MTAHNPADLSERLFDLFMDPDFLAMKGLANEVPIFIQTYSPIDEDAIRRMIAGLVNRLNAQGVVTQCYDLLALVLDELDESGILKPLVDDEASFSKQDLLETLQNFSNPRTRLIPRLIKGMSAEDMQLTFISGSGRVFPFLRTHTILESLQPKMIRHPVVIFFPGDYVQESGGGSSLRLFGSVSSPAIINPYYRATNLDHYRQ